MHALLLFALALTTTRIPLPHGFHPLAMTSGPDFVAVAGSELLIIKNKQIVAHAPAGANPENMDTRGPYIAIANHETDYVTLLTNLKPQTLHLHSKPHPHAIALGDFDRDGKIDVAVDSWAENRIMLLFGRDSWRGPGTPVDIGTRPYYTLSSADLDGDGNADIVASNFGHGTVTMLFGNGHGDFVPISIHAGPSPFSATIADVNGDGRPDIVVANYSGHATDTSNDGLTWIRNDGARRFTAFPNLVAKGDYSARIAAGDLDGDKYADVVFTNGNGSTITILRGSPSGPRDAQTVTVMNHPHNVAIVERCIAVTSDNADELWMLCSSSR